MNRFLLPGQSVQSLEDRVDVPDCGVEVEDRVEIDTRRDLGIGFDESAEVALLLPRVHRVALDEPVGVVTWQTGLDEREQETMAEHEPVARVEVAPHPLGMDDEAFDDP